MNNSETIAKLSDALNTLIGAYEDLQNENNSLKNTIEELEDAKNELESNINNLKEVKVSLEDNLDNIQDNNQKENTNINSMLGKIQNLLGNKQVGDVVKNEIPSFEEEKNDFALNTENIFDAVDKEDVKEENEEEKNKNIIENKVDNIVLSVNDITPINNEQKKQDDGKLDLNRMASLLNGFK
ncbi:MAG: hypothetical protein COA66_01690 [Arcobacter sp.]|nr:MAG: hypothetical protein COA66_01690 [Arcobacter sp.]